MELKELKEQWLTAFPDSMLMEMCDEEASSRIEERKHIVEI